MISFDEAYRQVIDKSRDFGEETVLLRKSLGRVLREDLLADRPFPPYDRITMDGIAFHAEGIGDERSLKIEGIAAAGAPQMELKNPHSCCEVMTGAILPIGADTVIRYEDLEIADGVATIQADFKQGQNIHRLGQDRSKGDLLVPAGTVIAPGEIGVAATIGKEQIKVARLPRVMIISTGDELVEINEQPLAHQIRKSNVYRIESSLKSIGIDVETDHLNDNFEEIVQRLRKYLYHYDALLLSGGVSMGKFDFLPRALEEIGVEKHFHKVAQRPGKPFWFGTHESGCTVFALPGNPISSFMCTNIYFMDWFRASMGMGIPQREKALLDAPVHFKPDLCYFMEVSTYRKDGVLMASPKRGNGSGDLANLVNADSFMKIPRGKDLFEEGEGYLVYSYR